MQDDYILQYDGDKKTAQKLGAFYTPPELGRRMVDKFSQSLVGKTCLDNCAGYGNLILQVLDKKVEQGEDPAKALSEVYGNEFSRKNLEVCIRNLRIWADRHGVKWDEDLIRSHFRQGDALTDEAYEFPDEKFGMDRHFEVEIRKDLGKAWLKVIVESRIRKEREYSLPDESNRLKNSIRRLLDLKFKMLKIEG